MNWPAQAISLLGRIAGHVERLSDLGSVSVDTSHPVQRLAVMGQLGHTDQARPAMTF